MRFYGLLDREIQEVVEFYLSLDAAERELDAVLRASWGRKLAVVVVDLRPEPPRDRCLTGRAARIA
jgi:hypothetical protein